MKILISTDYNDFINQLIRTTKEKHKIIVAKFEDQLFNHIENGNMDAYILNNDDPCLKKACDFIKKSNPYIPIIAILGNNIRNKNVSVDMFINSATITDYSYIVDIIVYNIEKYCKNFDVLQKLTAKMQDKIEFANCTYDPSRRILYHAGKEIKKLSTKEGGILEILATNYGDVVKKDVILEKVWRKTDYFVGRSCDVYVTYLRKTLKMDNMKLIISNISGIGLMLESI